MLKEITREKKQKENKKRRIRTLDLALISLFAAIIAILSLISIPFAIPFSMQSLGILFAPRHDHDAGHHRLLYEF